MELFSKNPSTKLHPALDINSYINDGFRKVCDVRQQWESRIEWYYENINTSIMFSEHRSWVYFIVSGNEIVKIGESGNPLGIFAPLSHDPWQWEDQPKKGTQSRFGRYRQGDGTDRSIRCALTEEVDQGVVSLWAKKCDIVPTSITIAGESKKTYATYHKDLELQYLNYIERKLGRFPRENKARK